MILIVGSLLGMLFVPKLAYSAPLDIVEIRQPAMPVLPVVFPGRLPIPSWIPGPAIQLPTPSIPLVSISGRISVVAFVAPRQENKGLFAAAQKAFAAAPGAAAPSAAQLKTGFDQGPQPSASGAPSAVDAKDVKKDEPVRRKRVERSRVIQVPTWELENEIGI